MFAFFGGSFQEYYTYVPFMIWNINRKYRKHYIQIVHTYLHTCFYNSSCVITTGNVPIGFAEIIIYIVLDHIILELSLFKRGPAKILHTDKNFWFSVQSWPDLDQTWWDCNTHDCFNVTKFGQDWTENKNNLAVCKILAWPLLKLWQL